MGRIGKVVVAAVAGLAAASMAASPAWAANDANSVAAKKCARSAGLASGIAWDHSDPLYMKVNPAVTWQNCRGAIRKVTLELRVMSPQGGLYDNATYTLTPDLDHQANGRQTYSTSLFVYGTGEVGDSTGSGNLQSCTKKVSGYASSNAGVTYYTIARAFDRNGKQILQIISPSVVCDQNG